MEQHDLSKIQKLQEKGKSDKIIKYLSSSDDTVVVAALEALSRIKDEDSVNSIAHMIDNPDTKIRIEAAKALGSIGTEYAKTYLLHRLNAEQDETVKTAIKEALHTLAEHVCWMFPSPSPPGSRCGGRTKKCSPPIRWNDKT